MVPVVKNELANTGDIGDVSSLTESGGSPGEGNGNPQHYFCLGNPMNSRAWQATVHGTAESQTRLNTQAYICDMCVYICTYVCVCMLIRVLQGNRTSRICYLSIYQGV